MASTLRFASSNVDECKVRGFLRLLMIVASLGLLVIDPHEGKAGDGEKQSGPVPRVARVSPPEAVGAVEVSVAINPTNPDHMIAASIARMKQHPGITDFAYVTNDAGRSWKTVPRANPHKVQQGD